MRKFIFMLFLFTTVFAFAQKAEVLDTVYYDSNWKGCSRTFASFYRVMTIPTIDNPYKQCRDYFITGELQGESKYIEIDREDDSKTIFDGDVVGYFKNGKIEHQEKWINSHRSGDAFYYYDNGNVKQHCVYNNYGNVDGNLSMFDENGNITAMVQFNNGIPQTHFTAYNQYGSMGQYDTETMKPVVEAVPMSEMKTKIIKGETIYYYDDCNGIYISIFVDAVKKYGKYYRVGISLFNNTSESILFDPTKITATGRFFKKNKKKQQSNFAEVYNEELNTIKYDPSIVKSKDVRVWTFADYTKKVQRRQIWDEVLVGLAAGLAAYDAGYSTSYSTSTTYGSAYGTGSGTVSAYGSGGYAYGSYNSSAYVHGSSTTTTTTTTYDATAAAIANEQAAYTIATYCAGHEADSEAINENYLQLTTVNPQSEIVGYVLINKDKPNVIDLTIPVNGAAYHFHITEVPK